MIINRLKNVYQILNMYTYLQMSNIYIPEQ